MQGFGLEGLSAIGFRVQAAGYRMMPYLEVHGYVYVGF